MPAVPLATFVAPRVPVCFNGAFRRRLREARERVEYARNGDVVPNVPLRPLYLHPMRLTRIGKSTGDPIQDHSISLYAADVAALPSN